MWGATASGSMRWSNATNTSGCRLVGCPLGYVVVTVGAGVVKLHAWAFFSVVPTADLVPLGTVTS